MKVRRGMQVRVEFDDHSEGDVCAPFHVFGRVARVTAKTITVHGWAYSDPKTPVDSNVQRWTIVRATIQRLVLLCDAGELE